MFLLCLEGAEFAVDGQLLSGLLLQVAQSVLELALHTLMDNQVVIQND